MFKKNCVGLLLSMCLLGLSGVAVGQDEQDVGDLASFGKEAKFFGYAIAGTVLVHPDCSNLGFPLGPDDRCFTINAATNSVTFDARDIGRIYFPQKTFNTIISLLSGFQYTYNLANNTAQNVTGRVEYRPYFTLESGVLSDPSLINPQTGQPFNGKVDIGAAGSRILRKTMFPGFQESDSINYGSSSVTGLTKKYFMENFGLSQQVVDLLFYEKMTIRLNIRGTTTRVVQGNFNYSVRFIGN